MASTPDYLSAVIIEITAAVDTLAARASKIDGNSATLQTDDAGPWTDVVEGVRNVNDITFNRVRGISDNEPDTANESFAGSVAKAYADLEAALQKSLDILISKASICDSKPAFKTRVRQQIKPVIGAFMMLNDKVRVACGDWDVYRDQVVDLGKRMEDQLFRSLDAY